jgi:UPF0176 protein
VNSILNISAYKFVPLSDLEGLKSALTAQTHARALKGTILIAEEGINLFLAAAKESLEDFLGWLKSDHRFSDLGAKESWSDHQPFKKMRIKIKSEIIRMNHPTIQPQTGRAPSISPEQLNQWLDQGHDDQGREVVLLDTRNAFEVSHGSFKNAIDFGIKKFSDFPQALSSHQDSLAGKTIVSFCTGGIRCEKAAIYMRKLGLSQTLQLEGGILNYFEKTDARHYRGDCFVFDDRELLDPTLATRPHAKG